MGEQTPLESTSYEELQSTFSWDDYWDGCDWNARDELNMGHESIDRHRDERGDDLALLWVGADGSEERYTFSDLADLSDRVATALEQFGVSAGDRVFTYLPRIPEHYAVVLGTLKMGAVFGAINERYGPDGIAHRLGDSRATAVLTTPENRGTVEEACSGLDPEILVVDRNGVGTDGADLLAAVDDADPGYETARTTPDDPALLYYTSGTTGPAKGVLHAHRFAVANAAFIDTPAGVTEDDLYWCTADLGWLTGLNPFGAWFNGAAIVVYEGEFDAERWVDVLDRYPIDVLFTVPTAYRMLEEHEQLLDDVDLSPLRTLLSVGEPLNPSVIEWAKDRFGVPILDTYGTSETYGTVVSNYPLSGWEIKPGSMGKPYPGIDIRLVKPGTLEEVDDDEIGEIAVRADYPSCFLEYWERPEKTDSKLTDGWVLTDDLASRDEDGYFWFEGRADDVILSAGYRIGPFDIESTLVEHDTVAEAAVVPKPDDQRGNIVKAFVVCSEGVEPTDETRDAVRAHVRNRLAAHEYPRAIEFVDELPKTVTGKIRRTELRDAT